MSKFLIVLAAVLGLAGLAPGQYHASDYLVGGCSSPAGTWNGIWLADAARQSVRHLTPNDRISGSRSFCMDVDNRHIVFSAGWRSTTSSPELFSGVYRLDPATLTMQTVMAHGSLLHSPGPMTINQDGDYVFGCTQLLWASPQEPFVSNVLKIDRTTGRLTTVFSSLQLGAAAEYLAVGRNMDTGNYLVNATSQAVLPRMLYGVLDVEEGGRFSTFAGAGPNSWGWHGYFDSMYQNFDTGAIEGQDSGCLYQLRPGANRRTTLQWLQFPGTFSMLHTSRFDVQSAARKRLVATGLNFKMIGTLGYQTPAIFTIDARPPHAVVAVDCDPAAMNGHRLAPSTAFEFYRGRHIQTVATGPRKWRIQLSFPRFPNRAYAMMLSAAGYRPGTPLPDGRRVYLVPDALTVLSARNALRPFFQPGPLTLDANGAAAGHLDLSGIGRLGRPLWIAVAILDPNAPLGVAYLPDTYVMRI